MKVSDENIHLFDPFRVGDLTDKGIIQDLFFLQFGSGVGAYRIYKPKGRGILMAKVNGKDHAIGNLKLIKDYPPMEQKKKYPNPDDFETEDEWFDACLKIRRASSK
jgi:hypothetical protein